jgi:hypothetical protein
MKRRRTAHNKSNTEEFISKALSVQSEHGREFDYSRVEYINAREKVEIGCKSCGAWFMQTPYVHLYGKGCSNCRNIGLARARSHTKEHFVEEALKVTGDKYSYDLVVYKNARTYVDIICNDCGITFKKKPTEILNGLGCRCHTEPLGYRPEEPASLYVMSCENIIKIGITNGDPKTRAKVIGKSYGKEFSVVSQYHMDGKVCTDLETRLLKELRTIYESPKNKFDGYTECFFDVNMELLYSQIEEAIRSFNDKTNICTLQ